MATTTDAEPSAPPPLPAEGRSLRFHVELVDYPATISYKKLLKEHSQLKKADAAPPAGANPALEARIAPQPVLQQEYAHLHPSGNIDDVPANRFSSVIEKIERLYKGRDSDEDTGDFEEDAGSDQYDSDDSFIDDQELDDYFAVEKGKTKYSGFFVNKGALEKVDVPSQLPVNKDVPKKRKNAPSKLKEGKAAKVVKTTHVQTKLHKARGPLGNKKKFPAKGGQQDIRSSLKPNVVFREVLRDQKDGLVANLGGDSGIQEALTARHITQDGSPTKSTKKKYSGQQGTGSIKQKGSEGPEGGSYLAPSPINGYGETSRKQDFSDSLKTPPTKVVTFASPVSESEDKFTSSASAGSKRKEGHAEGQLSKMPKLDDHDDVHGKTKVKGASNVIVVKVDKPQAQAPQQGAAPAKKLSTKSLERAILDLQAVIPGPLPGNDPSLNQDVDLSTLQTPGRMPRMSTAVKTKLGKVARLAAREGSVVPPEVVERLKDIMKPMMQPLSLKKHLKTIIEKRQSAREVREQQLEVGKKALKELVEARVEANKGLPPPASMAIAEGSGNSTNSMEGMENITGGKTSSAFLWDSSLEERVCDVYDHYAEDLVENKGFQVKRLYTELAALWPKGMMDNAGIKEAIVRVKQRQKRVKARGRKNKCGLVASGQSMDVVSGETLSKEDTQTSQGTKRGKKAASDSTNSGVDGVKKKLLMRPGTKKSRQNVSGGELGGKRKGGTSSELDGEGQQSSPSKTGMVRKGEDGSGVETETSRQMAGSDTHAY